MKIGDTKICKNERKEKKTVNKKIKNQLFVVEFFLRRWCFELSFFVFVVVLFFSYYFVCVCVFNILSLLLKLRKNLTWIRNFECIKVCVYVCKCVTVWVYVSVFGIQTGKIFLRFVFKTESVSIRRYNQEDVAFLTFSSTSSHSPFRLSSKSPKG